MMQQAEGIVRDAVEDLLLHGMSKTELEALMLRVFRKADLDRSGLLNRAEFKVCLKAAKLGLTRKDINLIMSTVDINHDGQISYDEFVPVCFQVGHGCSHLSMCMCASFDPFPTASECALVKAKSIHPIQPNCTELRCWWSASRMKL